MARGKKNSTNKARPVNARALWQILEGDWLDILMRAGLDRATASGSRIKARCPYHSDATPSFEVRADRGRARCFGCPAYVVDPLELIMRIRGCSLDEVIAWLLEIAPAARKILDTETCATIATAHLHQLLRRQIVERSCELLGEAIALWRGDGTEQALLDAHRNFALPTIQWLVERRFGLAPNESLNHPAVRERCRGVWRALATQGLIGVVPPTTVCDQIGDDADVQRAYHLTLSNESLKSINPIGWPLLPYRRLDGSIGQVRVRNLGAIDETSAKYFVTSHAETGGAGYFMSRMLVGMLKDPSFADVDGHGGIEPVIMEGETGVLTIEAARPDAEVGLAGVIALGGGQATTTSLEPLADTGIRGARVVGDPGSGGVAFVRKVALARRVSLSIHVLRWDPEQVGTAHGIKSPDDVVRRLGVDAWTLMTRTEVWAPLWRWCADRTELATRDTHDPARRGETAIHWGILLHGEQDRARYVSETADALGISPGPIERALVDLAEDAVIPRDLSSQIKIVHEIVRRLRGDGGVDPVYADGAVWRCTDGLWCEVSPRAVERLVMGLDGRMYEIPGEDGQLRVLLKANDTRSIARLVPVEIDQPGFFDDAPRGVADAGKQFLRAVDGKIVVEPLTPQHRQRWALPVVYRRVGYDALGMIGPPVGESDDRPRDVCPRFRRFLFEVLRATHCTCASNNEEVHGPLRDDRFRPVRSCLQTAAPDGATCHVCWPRDRVSPPTHAWLAEWRATVPLMRALIEHLGTSLLGEATRLKKAIIPSGTGDNGKSVYIKILHAVAKGATASMGPHEFSARFSRIALVGKRLNVPDEIGAREMIETDSYKAVISGGRVKAEQKGQPVFEFEPVAGHVYPCNELPATRDQTDGFWTRAMVFPMPHSFVGPTADRGLGDYLVAHELADIAAVALEAGAAALHRGDYTEAPQADAAKREWREEADVVLGWLRDATERAASPQQGDSSMDLYDGCSRWLASRGHAPISVTTFGRRLGGHRIQKIQVKGVKHYAIKVRASREMYGDKPSRQANANARGLVEPDDDEESEFAPSTAH